MPVPLLAAVAIGLLVGAVGSLSSAVLLNHKKAKQKLKAKPSGPPRAPSGMARSDLLKTAQERLGMDVKNHFNFALCGGSGSGKSIVACLLCAWFFTFEQMGRTVFLRREVVVDQCNAQPRRYSSRSRHTT